MPNSIISLPWFVWTAKVLNISCQVLPDIEQKINKNKAVKKRGVTVPGNITALRKKMGSGGRTNRHIGGIDKSQKFAKSQKSACPLGGGPDGCNNCFGYETYVTTGSGEQKLMRDLRIGDEVVSDETGGLTKFLGWLELNSKEKILFLEIQTEDGEKLIMTETHIVFHYEDGKPSPTYIRNLRPGNVLVGGSGEV